MALELSILIATTSERNEIIKPLLRKINSQINGLPVELIIDDHETNNVGAKRNNLLSLANGDYVVFVDSDDKIDDEYVKLILNACKSNADCIGINGIITTNGRGKRKWYISKQYGKWFERGGVYFRTPNHISPVKRELALMAGFPEIQFGEDAEYSRRLLPLLKTETIIKKPLYWYDYTQK